MAAALGFAADVSSAPYSLLVNFDAKVEQQTDKMRHSKKISSHKPTQLAQIIVDVFNGCHLAPPNADARP